MIIISFGANIDSVFGSPKNTFNAMPEILGSHNVEIIKISALYKASAYPDPSDPGFLNAVFSVKTALTPLKLLQTLNTIEEQAGRIRTTKNAPRPLDLDVLDYDGIVVDDSNLTLPHPHIESRAFVLYPLQDIAPNWQHPKTNKSVKDMLNVLPVPHQIKKIQ